MRRIWILSFVRTVVGTGVGLSCEARSGVAAAVAVAAIVPTEVGVAGSAGEGVVEAGAEGKALLSPLDVEAAGTVGRSVSVGDGPAGAPGKGLVTPFGISETAEGAGVGTHPATQPARITTSKHAPQKWILRWIALFPKG